MAAPLLVPVGQHYFTSDELNAALTRTLPQLPPGRTIGFGAAVDVQGVSTAVVFQSQDGHWQAKGAYAHDWTGDNRLGASVTFTA